MTIEEIREERKAIEKDCTVNSRGVITNPGKFEQLPLYVVYFYDMTLDGIIETEYSCQNEDDTCGHCEQEYCDCDHDSDCLTYSIPISDEERSVFPEIGDATVIDLWETTNGFVRYQLDYC